MHKNPISVVCRVVGVPKGTPSFQTGAESTLTDRALLPPMQSLSKAGAAVTCNKDLLLFLSHEAGCP